MLGSPHFISHIPLLYPSLFLQIVEKVSQPLMLAFIAWIIVSSYSLHIDVSNDPQII